MDPNSVVNISGKRKKTGGFSLDNNDGKSKTISCCGKWKEFFLFMLLSAVVSLILIALLGNKTWE